jgi:hypothetical protein
MYCEQVNLSRCNIISKTAFNKIFKPKMIPFISTISDDMLLSTILNTTEVEAYCHLGCNTT